MGANGVILRNHPYSEQEFTGDSWLERFDAMLLSRGLRGGSALVEGYRVQFLCYPLGPQPVSPGNDVEFKHLV